MIDLSSFNVPALRRDITSTTNVSWLLRNLAIQNEDNPLLKETLMALKELRRSME